MRLIDPLSDPHWDTRLASLPGASFFHTAAWARVLHGTYGFKPAYLEGTNENGVWSLLPLMEADSWIKGRRGIGLPFTDECSPLSPDPVSFRPLFTDALAYADKRGWKYLECRGGRSLICDAAASTSFWGHQLDLRGEESALFERFDPAARRAIRKAEQSGLSIETSQSLDAVREFYGLLCLTRRRHGLPAQPFRFFSQIREHVLSPGHGCVILARAGGKPVAGAVFFRFGKTVTYKFGASDDRQQHLRANNLVMWEAIKLHAKLGFESLDFGRTSLGNEGLRKFKLGWGTTERRVDYVRFDCRSDRFVTVPDEASGWYNYVFRILPVSASRLVGALLYRHAA